MNPPYVIIDDKLMVRKIVYSVNPHVVDLNTDMKATELQTKCLFTFLDGRSAEWISRYAKYPYLHLTDYDNIINIHLYKTTNFFNVAFSDYNFNKIGILKYDRIFTFDDGVDIGNNLYFNFPDTPFDQTGTNDKFDPCMGRYIWYQFLKKGFKIYSV
jgi:hypothetical protein